MTAVPLPEARDIKALEQASATESCQAQQPSQKTIVASVQDVQHGIITLQSPTLGEQYLKVDPEKVPTLQRGGQYRFTLASPPKATQWRATEVRRL